MKYLIGLTLLVCLSLSCLPIDGSMRKLSSIDIPTGPVVPGSSTVTAAPSGPSAPTPNPVPSGPTTTAPSTSPPSTSPSSPPTSLPSTGTVSGGGGSSGGPIFGDSGVGSMMSSDSFGGIIDVVSTASADVVTDLIKVSILLKCKKYVSKWEVMSAAILTPDAITTLATSNASAEFTSSGALITGYPSDSDIRAALGAVQDCIQSLSDSVVALLKSSHAMSIRSGDIIIVPIYESSCKYSKMDVASSGGVGVTGGSYCKHSSTFIVGYFAYERLTFEISRSYAQSLIDTLIATKGVSIESISHTSSDELLLKGEVKAAQRATLEAAKISRGVAFATLFLNDEKYNRDEDDEYWNNHYAMSVSSVNVTASGPSTSAPGSSGPGTTTGGSSDSYCYDGRGGYCQPQLELIFIRCEKVSPPFYVSPYYYSGNLVTDIIGTSPSLAGAASVNATGTPTGGDAYVPSYGITTEVVVKCALITKIKKEKRQHYP